MRSINRRLQALARVYGCRQHGEALVCHVCDADGPLPAWAQEGVETFTDHILARVSVQEIREAWARVPRPTTEPCRQCGSIRACLSCVARYAQALFREIGLEPGEIACLRALMSKVRSMD
jgi:hypothetical protein